MFSHNDETTKFSGNGERSLDQIKPEMTILVTHFVSPQQFWYIELGELEAKANAVHQIERKLIGHCHGSNQLTTYDQNQYVIVEFLPCSPKKYIRGVVCQSLDENYLVMALDYGFTINCSGKNLWLLPKELQEKCLNIKEGSVASVIPFNGSHWSKEGLHIFDQKLEKSSELSFIPHYNSLEKNVGQLFWKEGNQLVNAASYLVKNEYARLDVNAAQNSISSTFDTSFAEVNKMGTEPRLRVRKLIRYISTQILSECNYRFDKLLESRSFIIPKSALRISKVSRSGSTLDDSSFNSSKLNKPVDTDKKSSTRHKIDESLQNLFREAKTTLQLPIDKEKVNAITDKMNGITLNKKSLPDPPCSDDLRKMKYQSKASIPLAHSDLPVITWKGMQFTSFCPTIEKAMKTLNFHTILPTQMYAWPHLMHQSGNSLLLIDGPNTGRSWSYLPALCSLVIQGLQVINAKGGRLGPKAILLTDEENVIKLTNSCSILMQGYNTQIRKTVNTCSHTREEVLTILLDSCGILITTLEKLKDLLDFQCKTGIKLFDLNYLELFVCDDYERLCLSSNPKELNEVLQKFRGPSKSKYHFGLIVVSHQWHAKIFSKLIKNLPRSPLILFGDYLQAAMYGGLKLETVIRNANEKLNQLLKYLSQQKLKRTMIYCKNQDELDILTKELTRKDFQCITLTEAQNQQPHQLLLVTDKLVNESSHITKKNIEVLIHFSMPESWAKFALRFHSLMDNIPNILVPTPNPVRISTYLILDHSNHLELSRLVQFFDAHDIEVDECIRQVIVTYRQEIEMMRPFCPYLLSSGECNQKQQCNKRHHFVRADVQCGQSPMRQSGTIVRGKICKVYNPVHISVWPIEYKPLGSSTWLHTSDSVSRLAMELAISMALKRQPHQEPKIGDICVVQQEGQFKRVRIVDLPHGRPVTVQLIDFGTELLKVKPQELFECEAKFQTLPPLAMDVRLKRVEPRGGEFFKWSSEAVNWVSNSLGGLKDQQFIQINIDFTMLDMIYVNEIAVVEKCHTMKMTVHKLLLRKELISKGFGQQGANIDMELQTLVKQEQDINTNWPIEKNVEIAETIEEQDQFSEATEAETRIDSKSGNINRLGLMMNAINEFLSKTDSSEQSKSEQNGFIVEELEDPIIEEPPELDDLTQFVNSLINQLNNNDSSCDTNAAIQLLQNILGDENPKSNMPKNKDNLEKVNDITSSANISEKVLPQPTTDQTADALKCAVISDGAVCPNVKWRQSFYHIDLTFEQHVPQYKLIHKGNTIVYSVTETVPQHRCVLNLLGEVKILSEQQFGYNLRVKLAKSSLLNYWPSLLNSLYAQQHFRWLSYDTDRAQSPPLSKCHDLWQRYVNKDNFTYNANENDEDSVAPSSSDDLSERDVERCHSLTTDLFENC